jgi:hypothetical protein
MRMALPLGKSLICQLGGSSEVEASDGRFPVGPAEAESLARFSREIADRKQRRGVFEDEVVWNVGHLIQGRGD